MMRSVWILHTGFFVLMLSMQAFALENNHDPIYTRARIDFRNHNFKEAIAVLSLKEMLLKDDKWLLAESYFHLGNYFAAKEIFKNLFDSGIYGNEKKKVLVRYFDCALALNDTKTANVLYLRYVREFQDPPPKMRYGLGKGLWDKGDKAAAVKILQRIKDGNDFSIRSKYMIAVNQLGKGTLLSMLKPFKQIDSMPVVAAEDSIVKKMSILAQARIYSENKHYADAVDTYKKVDLNLFGEEATFELASLLLKKADNAKNATENYRNVSLELRTFVERESIEQALEAIKKYRLGKEIDWRNPRLLSLMSYLYGRSARYEEARISYANLLDHYNPVYEELKKIDLSDDKKLLFILDLENKSTDVSDFFPGLIPQSFFKQSVNVNGVLSLKQRVLLSRAHLNALSQKSANEATLKSLEKSLLNQAALENEYKEVALKIQNEIIATTLAGVKDFIAQAEYQKAQLEYFEMLALKKQLDVVREYRNQNMENFNNEIKKFNNNGGSL